MTLYSGGTVGLSVQAKDTEGRPATPLPGGMAVEVRRQDKSRLQVLSPHAMDLIRLDIGTATAGAAKTLTDAAQAWVNGEHAGHCVRIISGTGSGQERRIKSNDATTLTIDDKQIVGTQPVGGFLPAPDATSHYEIHEARYAYLWDSPAAPDGQDLEAIFKATNLSLQPHLVPVVVPFRLEAFRGA